jgi:soluble lytic murein transglycosylase
MILRNWRRTVGSIASASLFMLIACASVSLTRLDFINEVLQQRAKHLGNTERFEIARGLLRAERKTGADALLLLALMEEESHYRPRAKSRRGALGLLQIRPATGQAVAERNGIPWKGKESLFKPSVNLLIGAAYLVELEERFGSREMALAAYHQGPARTIRITKSGRRPSSRYTGRVLRRFETLRRQAEHITVSK